MEKYNTWVVQVSYNAVPCLISTFRMSILRIANVEKTGVRADLLDQIRPKRRISDCHLLQEV